jgi:hypothetical protein
MKSTFWRIKVILPAILMVAACAGNPGGATAQRCSTGLDTAFRELDLAKAEGFGGTVDWAKAASLLAAAKVQSEFEHYPNCIEKVDRARVYIRQSKSG